MESTQKMDLLNRLAFEIFPIILQKCFFTFKFLASDLFFTFKWSNFCAISFTKDVIKTHNPMKKQGGGTMIDPTVNDAIDSRNKAIK